MQTKIIEAVGILSSGQPGNWGKFLLGRFDSEWSYRSAIDAFPLLANRGWSEEHVLVLDLQTGEGAIFRHGGLASHDLNTKHKIWVCPLFESFLTWLYQQDVTDLHELPGTVELEHDLEFTGYRREGGAVNHY